MPASILSLLLPLAGIWVLVWVLRYGLLWMQWSQMILQYPQYELTPDETVSPELKAVLESITPDLAAFGFEPSLYLATQPTLKLDFSVGQERLYHHPETGTYAKVNIRLSAEATAPLDVEFQTQFIDGTWLITMNGRAYGLLHAPPQAIIQDAYSPQLQDQWQLHVQKLQALSLHHTVKPLPPEAFATEYTGHGALYLDTLEQKGYIRRRSDVKTFQATSRGTRNLVLNYAQAERKIKAIARAQQQRVQKNPSLRVELPVEVEVQNFQAMDQLQSQLGRGFKWPWLLWLSLGLFLASFAHRFSFNWVTLLLFTGVLVLHEAGHLLAMKLFGYRDISMLFLPFLGAVATARKEDASLFQKMIVLLAGPLPGLLLGIGLLLATQNQENPAWMGSLIGLLIGLNGFNLLPIYPLDGGQITHLLMFSGYTYGDVLFRSLAVLGLGCFAFGNPALLVIVLLVGRSIPTGFRTAQLTTRLKTEWRQQTTMDRAERLGSIFQAMRSQGFSHLSFSQRYVLVKTILDKQREIKATWRTRMGLILLYLTTLMGSIAGILFAIMPAWPQLVTSYIEGSATAQRHYSQRLELANQQIKTHPKQAKGYLERAQVYWFKKNQQQAVADLNYAVHLEPRNPEVYRQRGLWHKVMKQEEAALADFEKFLRLVPNDKSIHGIVGNIYEKKKDYPKAIAHFDRIVAIDSKDFWAYVSRGSIRFDMGNKQGALADANTALKLHPESPDGYALRGRVRNALGDRTGAFADQQKADQLEATALADDNAEEDL